MEKLKQTYHCKKCNKIIRANSDEELKAETLEHSKNCDGKLEVPKGNCLPTALLYIIRNPHWSFCYTYINLEDQKYLHAWNESKGIIKDGKVVSKGITEGKNFVFDYSNNRKIAAEKEKYYSEFKIKEEDVKKLKLKEVLNKIIDCIDNNKDIWNWIE
jgi:hypothetical protein